MKKFFTVVLLIIVAFVGGVAVGHFVDFDKMMGKGNTYKVNNIEEQVKEISELATVEYRYTNTDELSGDNALKIFGKSIPFTSKSMVVQYDGKMKFGPDLSKAKVEVDENEKVLTITIPHSKVLSHEIDEESYKILDKQNGLFNPVTPEDNDEFRKAQVKKMEETIKKDGLLKEADEKASTQIKTFFETAYPKLKVEVEFIKK